MRGVALTGLSPSADAERYRGAITTAVRALVAGDLPGAYAATSSIAGEIWPGGVLAAKRVREASLTPGASPPARPNSTEYVRLKARAYVRDRAQCRYCGQRLIPTAILVALHSKYPSEVPYNTRFRRGSIHSAFWLLGTEADHVHAGSRGGRWDSFDNLATACVVCNTAKGDADLEDLDGWTLRDPADQEWDGLIPLYRPLWQQVGRPTSDGGGHKSWLPALEAARAADHLE